MKKALLIDGNSIINRAYYGIRNMYSNEGIPTNAIYGFINKLLSKIEELSPEYIVVCFDISKKNFRHEIYEDYKGNRGSTDEELKVQFPILKQILKNMNISIFEKEGYEADDLLGIFSNVFYKNNISSYIYSGDRDLLQLVNDNIFVCYEGKNNKIYDYELVKNDMNVEPKYVIDLKAIMGDSSDNIPGIKGIGEKGAVKLINEYGNLENILENVDNIKNNKTKEAIKLYKDDAIKFKKIVTILTESHDFEINLENFLIKEYDYENLIPLLKMYNLNKFISIFNRKQNIEINKKNTENISDKSKNNLEFKDEKIKNLNISSINEIDNFLKNIDVNEYYIFESIYIKDNIFDDIYEYLLISDLNQNYVLVSKENVDYLIKKLEFIFSENEMQIIGFNLNRNLLLLKNYFLKYKVVFDLQIAMYLLEPNIKNHTLNKLAIDCDIKDDLGIVHILCLDNIQKYIEKKLKKNNILENDIIEYFSKYLHIIKNSLDILKCKISDKKLENVFYGIELKLIDILVDMEYTGISIDNLYLENIGKKILDISLNIEEEIFGMAGVEFNINSPKQLSEILFEKLLIPHSSKGKTGYSTDKEELEKLSQYHPIINKIIEYRMLTKFRSTYVDGILKLINKKSKKIHTTFSQINSATGRIVSIEPNLQNIPIKTKLGMEFRKVFIGNKYFVDADYSQIELRILAHLSEDENLLKAYNEDIDIHTLTASNIFNIPIEEVTTEHRSKAKSINFGIIYGMSSFGLSKNLSIPVYLAKEYIQNYFKKYPKVSQYLQNEIENCKNIGYTKTITGRIRDVVELKSNNKNVIKLGERLAMNSPIQGSAADIIKLAMIKVYYELKERNLKSKLVLQIHDELLIDTCEDEIEIVKEILKKSMENAVKLKVNLVVDMNVGKNWYECK